MAESGDANTFKNEAEDTRLLMDWSRCLFCQSKKRRDHLLSPSKSKRPDIGLGYKSVAESLLKFREIDALPFPIDVDQL